MFEKILGKTFEKIFSVDIKCSGVLEHLNLNIVQLNEKLITNEIEKIIVVVKEE